MDLTGQNSLLPTLLDALADDGMEDRTIPPEEVDNSCDQSGSSHRLKGTITIGPILLVSFQIYFVKRETIYKYADGSISQFFFFTK